MRRYLALFAILLAVSRGANAAVVWSGDVIPTDPLTWTNDTDSFVGKTGVGTLLIDGGSNLVSSDTWIGENTAASGHVIVSGNASTWTHTGALTVGDNGNGALEILGGGVIGSRLGHVGRYGVAGTSSVAIVDGAGSAWNMTYGLTIGFRGVGRLEITNGGKVSAAGGGIATRPRFPADVHGWIEVDGEGSTLENRSILQIGVEGSGIVTISNGGLVIVGNSLELNEHSEVALATGGMLALNIDADDSLAQFLDQVEGSEGIRYWDNELSQMVPIANAVGGEEYELQYMTEGDLAGYTVLTVTAAGPPGDFSGNLSVDGRDFLAWQQGLSAEPQGAADLADWESNYGWNAASTTAAAAIPEPPTAMLAALVMGVACRRTARRAVAHELIADR